jgi:hypothetical protein
MAKVLKIGNAQAFWGDRNEAAAELLQQEPELDFLTLDYLSEVSLSIMAVQREKDASAGYAKDFLDVVTSLIPFWNKGARVKVITNAGGLDPLGCAGAIVKLLKGNVRRALKVCCITGDSVLDTIRADPANPSYSNLDTGKPISTIMDRLTTANAYLGAKAIAEALHEGADIIVTGRIADPSMVVAPCVAAFGWHWEEYDKLAQATVAGHLIECGTQVTGGISDGWMHLKDHASIGFPIVEVDADGGFVVTKGKGSSGAVTIDSVKEQLLYEIGDPAAYLSPDVSLSMLSLALKEEAPNRIRVSGAVGKAPPRTLKVSGTYKDGFKAEGSLVIYGRDCRAKAKICGEVILERMKKAGFVPDRSLIECLGCGDVVPGIPSSANSLECVLRVCVADHRREALEYFSKQFAPLVTAGPPGTTGYTTGRPAIRPVFGYWPCLIEASLVSPQLTLMEIAP